MTDLPPPGANICGQMRYSGNEREEICTFPPHNDQIPHLWQDWQTYYDSVMGYYDRVVVETGQQLNDEMRRARASFIWRMGVALQRLKEVQERAPKGERPEIAPPVPPSRPVQYPPLKLVRPEDIPSVLGICGATKSEGGETFICVDEPDHEGKGRPRHNWVNYEVAKDNADYNFTRILDFERDQWKQWRRILEGSRPVELPPFGTDFDPPVPEPPSEDEDGGGGEGGFTPLPPQPDMPADPTEDERWQRRRRGQPGRPRTRDEEGRYPLDPEQGGGHVGRGPGDPRWEEARDKGAQWDEDSSRPPAPPDAKGSTPEVPPDVGGHPAGAGLGRTAPVSCSWAERREDGLYVCVAPFGHIRRFEPHDMRKIDPPPEGA